MHTELEELMEKQKVLENRSWLGMRKRFQKSIMKKLESYDFLTEEQRAYLRERTIVKDEKGRVATDENRRRGAPAAGRRGSTAATQSGARPTPPLPTRPGASAAAAAGPRRAA